MLKNKKSGEITSESLVILVITILSIVVLFTPSYSIAKSYLFNTQKKYNEAFDNFVKRINDISLQRDTFEIKLKEKSAIIGFSKNADAYEYIYSYAKQDIPITIFNKPTNEKECDGYACICLCEGLQLIEKKYNDFLTKFGQCSKMVCKKIEQDDIANKIVIKVIPSNALVVGHSEYWKNGFLFVNGLSEANGLRQYDKEIINLIVEKKQNIIAVCNQDISNVNKKELKSDTCITTG